MSRASWQREAEQVCGQWLDGESLPSDGDVARAAGADEQMRRHIADQQLVDALLYSLSGRDVSDVSRRARRVMDAILIDRLTPIVTRRMTGVMSFVGLAAGLLIACTLLAIRWANESRANDVLSAIRQASLTDTDRVYHVLHTNAERSHAMESLGKLYLRGTTGFVLQAGEAVFGRYGVEYWMVPSHGPVIVADDFGWLESASSGDAIEVELLKDLSVASPRAPLMQVSAIVELVRDNYDVVVRRGQEGDLPRLDELAALRRSADVDLPARIRLAFDRETKIVHRVELTWNAADREVSRHGMQFVLAPTESVNDNWYQHATHHAADRPVRRALAEPAVSPSPAQARDKEL